MNNSCLLEPNTGIKDIIVGLSFACNLNCYNCWYTGQHFDIQNKKALYFHVLSNLKGNKLKSITLTNKGEPFFYLEETLKYL